MTHGSLLLLAQIDDAPGELLARVMEQLPGMGAKNVQLLTSLGKKGRPGYVLLVDIPPEAEADVAAVLAGELGIWGYRVLQSQHKHLETRRHAVELELHFDGNARRFPLRVKQIFSGGTCIRVKAEHDDLSAICSALSAGNRTEYLAVLKTRIESAIGTSEPSGTLVLRLDSADRADEAGRESRPPGNCAEPRASSDAQERRAGPGTRE